MCVGGGGGGMEGHVMVRNADATLHVLFCPPCLGSLTAQCVACQLPPEAKGENQVSL